MWRFVLRLLVPWVLAVPATGHAQQERSLGLAGERVRVTAPTVRGEFIVAQHRGDTLSLRRARSSEITVVPMESLERLDVRHERSRAAGALHGAGVGLLVGGGLGAALGLSMGSDGACLAICSAAAKAGLFGMLFGAVGGVVGTVIGSASPGGRWEQVDLARRLVVRRDGGGGVALTYSFRF